jgi:hypothetical protein
MKQCSLILLTLLLSACQSPEQIEAARQHQMEVDYNTCVQDYGFRKNSDAARNCMLQIELAREQENSYYYGGSYWDRHPHGYGGSGVYFMNRY